VRIGLNKVITVSILVFIVAIAILVPFEVNAQNTNLGITILQVTPSGTAPIGTSVNVQGTIYTANGSYQILLGTNVVRSGDADGFYVNDNFTVPELQSGTYALTLKDVQVASSSNPQEFTISTGYSINAVPASVQEGNSVALNVAVNGGQQGKSYSAIIAVSLPNSATTYSKTVSLGTPNDKGTASAQVTFPDSSFQPAGAVTDYSGSYKISFNQSLASTELNVNILDSSTYHKGQTVNIRATGYQPSQTATITITSSAGNPLQSEEVTASSVGLITSSWVVSSAASIGDYTVRINPSGTQKAIADQQTFTVEGYSVKVITKNLNGAIVPSITLQAEDAQTQSIYSATSGPDGAANFKLETGTNVLTAFWNTVNVGQTNITVSGEATFTMTCQLTDLKITTENTQGVVMPFVNLNIAYHYQSPSGSKTGNATGQTGPSGSFTLNSVLPAATYTIDASVYNQIFNAGNNTASNLPGIATSQVSIICPDESITFSVIGFSQQGIPNARIELVELSNGLFYSAKTDNNGATAIKATFGMYRARIFKDNFLINETNIQVFSSGQKQIRANLYGIELTVSVVDFLGSPISNVQVTINGQQQLSKPTQNNGKATFNDIVGGNMQIIAQASGTPNAYQAVTVNIDQPSTIQIKMDRYIALGSMLIQASSLITILIIVSAVIAFTFVEVIRRRRLKPNLTR
jgi:Carboxypeptidase regulatory-like domain